MEKLWESTEEGQKVPSFNFEIFQQVCGRFLATSALEQTMEMESSCVPSTRGLKTPSLAADTTADFRSSVGV